jgi:hypothetical protein
MIPPESVPEDEAAEDEAAEDETAEDETVEETALAAQRVRPGKSDRRQVRPVRNRSPRSRSGLPGSRLRGESSRDPRSKIETTVRRSSPSRLSTRPVFADSVDDSDRNDLAGRIGSVAHRHEGNPS